MERFRAFCQNVIDKPIVPIYIQQGSTMITFFLKYCSWCFRMKGTDQALTKQTQVYNPGKRKSEWLSWTQETENPINLSTQMNVLGIKIKSK